MATGRENARHIAVVDTRAVDGGARLAVIVAESLPGDLLDSLRPVPGALLDPLDRAADLAHELGSSCDLCLQTLNAVALARAVPLPAQPGYAPAGPPYSPRLALRSGMARSNASAVQAARDGVNS